ncbi:unnamed protein product [Rhizoctonia solani]|uniref:Uncharacterized protein n=1 Tax=Rhizoctonia solani TaxID=456999 RepID=A0A8H3BWT5_9AGAM|nr:unnamed protein product [Rhizoctonia solani]
MGLILALLLLLNLGAYQEYYIPRRLKSQRARGFNWLDANWILPTIAFAYGVEFLVEVVLAYFAKRATVRSKLAADEAKEADRKAMAETSRRDIAAAAAVAEAIHLGGPWNFKDVSGSHRATPLLPIQDED